MGTTEKIHYCKQICTVGDLAEFLSTLDQDTPIVAEYVKMFGNNFVGLEQRPVVSEIVSKRTGGYRDEYVLGPMFY